MGFWIYMIFSDMLIPLLMIVFGAVFIKKSPGKINPIFGYRTAMSMKNEDTWNFAHRHIGKNWLYIGIIMAAASAAVLIAVMRKDVETVGAVGLAVCIVQILIMVLSIIPTEVALYKNFDRDGQRKEK